MEKDLRKLNRAELVEVIYNLRVELDKVNKEYAALQREHEMLLERGVPATEIVPVDAGRIEDAVQTLLARTEGAQDAEHVRRLERENRELRERLDRRALIIGEAGNIAEATVGLTEIFEKAQKTAEEYLKNIRISHADSELAVSEARARADAMIKEAEDACKTRVEETDRAVAEKWQKFQQCCDDLVRSNEVLCRVMGS